MADLVATASDSKGRYVPIRERDIANDLLEPIIENAFCFGELRKELYKWYPGPTICMHKMHWTEYMFGSMFLFCVISMMVLDGVVPMIFFAVILTVNSVLALIFLWNIAKYKSLADAATELEKTAQQNHGEIQALQDINSQWDSGLEKSKQNLSRFAQSLGCIEASEEQIAEAEQQLSGLVNAKRKLMEQEKECFKVELKYARVTRANLDEQKRANLKRSMANFFDRTDRRGNNDGMISGDELPKLRQHLEKDHFLNMTDETTGKRLFLWEDKFATVSSDGTVNKWELLDAIDEATESYFLEVRDAVQTNAALKKKLKSAKQQSMKNK